LAENSLLHTSREDVFANQLEHGVVALVHILFEFYFRTIQSDEYHLGLGEVVGHPIETRLAHQIRRLTELRDALQDIAETTKRHQNTIVTGVLNNLDIHHYYRQLDPHPAYTALQIEPELTDKGTYNYWIKALTEDYVYGTYVQTRFSTAQANCAAIAIFLAVNQHLSKTLETILLDDPSQSMDPDHKERLAQTLASSTRQVIVATEDPQM
jgi:DNA repair exonuclease SbcCD ATPase subunit